MSDMAPTNASTALPGPTFPMVPECSASTRPMETPHGSRHVCGHRSDLHHPVDVGHQRAAFVFDCVQVDLQTALRSLGWTSDWLPGSAHVGCTSHCPHTRGGEPHYYNSSLAALLLQQFRENLSGRSHQQVLAENCYDPPPRAIIPASERPPYTWCPLADLQVSMDGNGAAFRRIRILNQVQNGGRVGWRFGNRHPGSMPIEESHMRFRHQVETHPRGWDSSPFVPKKPPLPGASGQSPAKHSEPERLLPPVSGFPFRLASLKSRNTGSCISQPQRFALRVLRRISCRGPVGGDGQRALS